MMTSRGKPDASKAGCTKPRHSPGPESPDNSEANETLLLSMRDMMDEMRNDIVSKFDSIISTAVKREIKAALESFENIIATQSETIANLESAANDHDSRLADLQAKVSTLTTLSDSLSKKCEDLESRSRWNNVRVVGLPEGSEGPRPTEFIAHLLQDLLGLDDGPILDRAHRTLRAKPKDEEPPRPMVIRVNQFQVRNQILRKKQGRLPLFFKRVRGSQYSPILPQQWLRNEPPSLK